MEKTEIKYLIIAGTAMLLLLGIFIITLLWNYYKRNSVYRNKLLLIEHQKQQAILQSQIEIQEQTLKNISQEIHDNIGQVLSLAKLNLNSFPAITDHATFVKVNDTKQLISKALHDLRNLSRSMHGDKIAELGLQESISFELNILQNTGKFTTALCITGTPVKLEPQKEMVIFRMVQEALNNAIKHSRATHIEVKLQYDQEAFHIYVIDNGIGFNPAKLQSAETGIGLKNMQNRAALIGAIFSLKSGAENGTEISIELNSNTV